MLRVLIVDDETPARERLRRLLLPLAETGRIHIVGEAADGFQALDVLTSEAVDLLFLDIQMPELDGFGVLERIVPDERPAVVFVTAYDEYALRAFEANATDYLLKPISQERLNDVIQKIEKLTGRTTEKPDRNQRLDRLLDWLDAQSSLPDTPVANRSVAYIRQLSIPFREKILIIPVSRLVAVEVTEGITRLFILDEATAGTKPGLKQHTVGYTLDHLESSLDPDAFLRVHRSAMVQLDHIKEMIPWFSGRYKLVLTGGHEVIASRERSKVLKDRLMI